MRKPYSRYTAPRLPSWAESGIIYEVNTRQYTAEGTFRAFAAHLPRLKNLGVNILWFMPIHPIGLERRKGTLGSYYSVKDYFAVNPEFGTLEDFKELVREAHRMGMFVIIDLVADHTARDHPWTAEHPEWYVRDKSGEIRSPLPDWTDTAELDYTNRELWRQMTEVMLYWVREADIDGYRCDVAEMTPASFWRRAIAELRRVKPVLMLAEGQHPWLHAAGFHLSYSFNLCALFNDIAAGRRSPQEIDWILELDSRCYPRGARRLRYTDNHDLNSWIDPAAVRLGDAARALAVLTFTLPGTPLIYSGQEIGCEKRLPFFEKDEIVWCESPWFTFYRTLCRAHKRPALSRGLFQRLKGDQPSVYGFIRSRRKDQAVVLVNLGPEDVQGLASSAELSGHYRELFDCRVVTIEKELPYHLPPWGFRIYFKES